MILPDVNLLVYAHDTSSPWHAGAAKWWAGCLNGTETVGLAPAAVGGFLRIVTHARIFQSPMSAPEAAGHVRNWLACACAVELEARRGHLARLLDLVEGLGTAGNLVTDAQLAALALEHDAVLNTTDGDFLRFPGLRWRNPLTGAGSAATRRRGR